MVDVDTLEQIIVDFEGNVHSTEFAKELIKHIERSLPLDFKYGKDYERIGWEASINDLIAWLNNYPENYINPNEVIWEINKRFNRSTTTKPEASDVQRVKFEISKFLYPKGVWNIGQGMRMEEMAKAAIAAMRPAEVDENAAAKLVQDWIRDTAPHWVVTISEAQDLVMQLRPYLRDTKPVSSPPALVKAVIESIDKLGAMKMDEIHAQNDVGFMELLDMAITLRNQVRPLSGWQPIETAPKDGTKIDILTPSGRYIDVQWSEGLGRPGWWNGKYVGQASYPEMVGCDATHWMPLPSSPKQETV